jgi:hypothetical protein
MGVAARNLLIQFLLPLAAVGATVPLRLPFAARRLLPGAALFAGVCILLAAGRRCHRGRFNYVRLPTLGAQLVRQIAQIGAQGLSQNGIGRVHRNVHRSGTVGYSNCRGALIVARQV